MAGVSQTGALSPTEYAVDPDTVLAYEEGENDREGPNHPRIRNKSSHPVSGAVQRVMDGCGRLEKENQFPSSSCSPVFLTCPHVIEGGAADRASWQQSQEEEKSSRKSLSKQISEMSLQDVAPRLAIGAGVGGLTGGGISALVGVGQKAAAEQAKNAALLALDKANVREVVALLDQTTRLAVYPIITGSSKMNREALQAAFRGINKGQVEIRMAGKAVAAAEEVATAATARAAGTEILSATKTAAATGLGATIGAVLGGLSLFLEADEVE